MVSTLTLQAEEFQLLRTYIEKECGIALGDEKMYLIENRLAQLVEESGCESFGAFYHLTQSETGGQLREKVVDAMTTNETLWFRDESPYVALEEFLLPQWEEELRNGSRQEVKIWSAACSTGQEPYSMVMVFLEHLRRNNSAHLWQGRYSIWATDISKSALMLAKLARYNDIAMSRGMREEYQERYFESKGRVHILADEVKQPIQFEKFNLQDSFFSRGPFDLIMLRNVAIYFAEDFKRDLFHRLGEILKPGGYLVLGSTESLLGITNKYQPQEFGRAIFYGWKN